MSSAGGPSLAHRTVSSIRTGTAKAGTSHGRSGPPSPQTPSRNVASAFGSPSSLRADEDVIVIELGSRFVRAGFGGDAIPKAIVPLIPDQNRRMGDFRPWLDHNVYSQLPQGGSGNWAREYELWEYDIRNLDLGLVEDKLERVLKDILTQ